MSAASLLAHVRRHTGMLALGTLCLLGTNALAQAIPWVVKLAIDAVERGAAQREVGSLALAIAGLAAAGALVRVGSRVLIFNVGRQIEYEVRNDLFDKLLALPPSFYRGHATGDLMSRLTADLGSVRALMGPGILYVANTAFAYAIALPLMLRIDPWLTAAALAPYPLLFLCARAFGRGIYQGSREVQEELGALGGALQEDLTGVQVIKGYAIEAERTRHFVGRSERLRARSVALSRLRALVAPLMAAVAGLGVLVALLLGGRMVASGSITLGDLVAFLLYLGILAMPTSAVGWILALWQRGLASWERLAEVLRAPVAIADPPADAPGGLPEGGGVKVRGLTVELDSRRLLDGVDLEVPPGTACGIVGRVGSGKTTLVESIVRLVEVPGGAVFVGGRDVTRVPLRALRSHVAYAPQDAFLFSTSIRDNIGFGVPAAAPGARGDGADDTSPGARGDGAAAAALAEAMAAAAGLEPDLAALPEGLDTQVGERGITLSGGQRQRTALARALASRAPVLILDDSLSSVDVETERRALAALRDHIRGRTVLIVSHRVAALRDADQIVVLEGGRVVERGRHEELIARGGVYADLYRRQLIESELEALP